VSIHLIRSFSEAGLRLVLPERPMVPADEDIFQMDIRRERDGERFRLWPGHVANTVRVTNADRGRRQLVLLVQEPSRRFEESLPKRAERPPFRILKETASRWIVERWTQSASRRYLCGLDERHCFIAQFRNGTTVKDAHRELKPDAVRDAERSHHGRLLRQGEWFFVPLQDVERRVLAAELREMPYSLRRRESLGGNGRPHVADEVVRSAGRVYARGAVRHPDHKTLVLADWHRVHRNAEVRQTTFGSNGVYWID
jgi:hypothetical protein